MRFSIRARDKWNHTGLVLDAGGIYRFVADGQWIDWYITYGPAGGDSGSNLFLRPVERFRRRPKDNWFALIGAVGEDESTTFLIGAGKPEFRAEHSGELTCYANDMSIAYVNNRGSVSLSVERLA